MPKFGNSSTRELSTCNPLLRMLFNEVIREYDCSILEGVRTLDTQKMYFETGRSKTMNSKHLPDSDVRWWSDAVDVVPYPISWGETERSAILEAFVRRDDAAIKKNLDEYKAVMARFYHFAGYVKGVANQMNIGIRWGGDWDSDQDFSDQEFHDLPHFQLGN